MQRDVVPSRTPYGYSYINDVGIRLCRFYYERFLGRKGGLAGVGYPVFLYAVNHLTCYHVGVWVSVGTETEAMELPKQFDNITQRVIDDLKTTLRRGSKVSMAAASFSIYAFEALQKELEQPHHIVFVLVHDESAMLLINYKDWADSTHTKFKITQAFASPWIPLSELELTVQGQSLLRIYDNFVAQVSGIGEHKAGALEEIVALKAKIAKAEGELESLQKRMRKEPQLDRQLAINKQVKAKRQELSELKQKMEGLGV